MAEKKYSEVEIKEAISYFESYYVINAPIFKKNIAILLSLARQKLTEEHPDALTVAYMKGVEDGKDRTRQSLGERVIEVNIIKAIEEFIMFEYEQTSCDDLGTQYQELVPVKLK